VVIHCPGTERDRLAHGTAPAEMAGELLPAERSRGRASPAFGAALPPGSELLTAAMACAELMVIGNQSQGRNTSSVPARGHLIPRAANAARSSACCRRWLKAAGSRVSYRRPRVMRDWQGKMTGQRPTVFTARCQMTRLQLDHAICARCDRGLPRTHDFSRPAGRGGLPEAYDESCRRNPGGVSPGCRFVAGSPIFGDAPGTPDRAKRDQLRRVIDAV